MKEGDFFNEKLKMFCEILNIRICTSATENPWINGLVECCIAVLVVIISKTLKETFTWMWLLPGL